MAPLDLGDALDVIVLLGEVGDPRFGPWSARWVARVAAQRRLQPAAVEEVRRLLRQVPRQNEARAVTTALRSYAAPPRTWS